MFERVSSLLVVVMLFGGVGAGIAYGYPNYLVWQQGKQGEAALAKATQDRQIKVQEAEAELEAAKKLLIKQKPLVQAYVIDQVRDKMIGNEAALGVIYSGEALYCQKENPDLEYVIPKEGSNLWIDALVIPKNAQNKKNAEAFINYLCRPDIAKMNFDYITYSIPNSAGRELIEDESMRESNIAFPDISQLKNCETFNFLGDENEIIYNQLWREIKSK